MQQSIKFRQLLMFTLSFFSSTSFVYQCIYSIFHLFLILKIISSPVTLHLHCLFLSLYAELGDVNQLGDLLSVVFFLCFHFLNKGKIIRKGEFKTEKQRQSFNKESGARTGCSTVETKTYYNNITNDMVVCFVSDLKT